MTSPPDAWRAHIGHTFSLHHHILVGKTLKPCSGKWWCQRDKEWIEGPKCHENGSGSKAVKEV